MQFFRVLIIVGVRLLVADGRYHLVGFKCDLQMLRFDIICWWTGVLLITARFLKCPPLLSWPEMTRILGMIHRFLRIALVSQ